MEAVDYFPNVVSLLGGPRKVFGRRKVSTAVQLHELLIEPGLPGHTLVALADHASLRQADLAPVVGISPRSLARYAAGKPLGPDQSWRVWCFARLLLRAEDVLGSRALANDWLQAPAVGLGRKPPIELLATGAGAEEVERLLGRIEHGVYS